MDFSWNHYTAVYKNFKVHINGPYKLEVSHFDKGESTLDDWFAWNNDQAFSTLDEDNDDYD